MVTTSRTTTKVVSCLKVPLTSMCVVVRTSFPGSRLRRFFLTSPLPELVFQSIEETLLQPVLKTFITVFIQYNVGLENKLTKTPLLGLAKSIYYHEPTKNMQRNYQGKHCPVTNTTENIKVFYAKINPKEFYGSKFQI